MKETVRAVVTFAVVVIVGAYVLERLAGDKLRPAPGAPSYVSARGVIDEAKRITTHAAKLPLAERLRIGKGNA